MLSFLKDLFYRHPKWSDPKAEQWANLFQKRARFYGQLPDPGIMEQMGIGPEHRFWKQDNRNPRKGFAANFWVPLAPFIDGTEDDEIGDVTGSDDFGRPVTSFPIGMTAARVNYSFLDRILDVPFNSEEMTATNMVQVCCGILALRVLPRREEFSIPANWDFRKAYLKRIVWDVEERAWCPLFHFDGLEIEEPDEE
jgi:hypothetical protein